MRVFVALDLDEEIREKIRLFIDVLRELAPDARWVSLESLHVTLKFIGEKPDAMVKQIEESMGSIKAQQFQLAFRGSGFFPTPRAARVFWVGIEAAPELAKLAAKIEDSVAAIQIPREKRLFSPHLTLARAGGGSGAPSWRKGDKPNLQFAKLQHKMDELPVPDFGTMTAREFFLYRSQLSSNGARYTKLARFGLGSQDHGPFVVNQFKGINHEGR